MMNWEIEKYLPAMEIPHRQAATVKERYGFSAVIYPSCNEATKFMHLPINSVNLSTSLLPTNLVCSVDSVEKIDFPTWYPTLASKISHTIVSSDIPVDSLVM
jgi:hypothetical protein